MLKHCCTHATIHMNYIALGMWSLDHTPCAIFHNMVLLIQLCAHTYHNDIIIDQNHKVNLNMYCRYQLLNGHHTSLCSAHYTASQTKCTPVHQSNNYKKYISQHVVMLSFHFCDSVKETVCKERQT